ncbi:nodulation protein NfeD, partial [Klebsiella pneumoniae]
FMAADHPAEALFDEEFVCLAWADNPHTGETLTLDAWQQLGHVSVVFGRERQPGLEGNLFAESGLSRRIEVVTHSYHCVPQLLIGTSRIATLHRRLAEQYAAMLPLRLFPVPVTLPMMREFIGWHRSLDNDPIFGWLKAKIVASAS